MSRILIIGIGNPERGDDAAGLIAAERLRREAPGGVVVQQHTGDGASLILLWDPADRVVLIDAVVSGAAAGTIHHLDLAASPVPAGIVPTSSHAFGVREGVELARTMRMLPASLVLIGIEGEDFSHGHTLSAAVAGAVCNAAELAATI